jgi:hypothetical protein
MVLLPVVGFIVGFAIGRREGLFVTAALAALGFGLVGALTDEIDGWGDPWLWTVTVIALIATVLGIGVRRRFAMRRDRIRTS